MSRHWAVLILSACLSVWSFSGPLLADQSGDTNTKKAASTEAAPAKKASNKKSENAKANANYGRLPRYYGRLELKAEQRSQVYSIQEEFGKQIDALLRQIDVLKSQRDQKLKSVLTAGQKRELSTRVNASLAARTKPKE